MKKISETLNSQEENYILPFFWQHGEEESVLRNYIEKIRDTGIKAICIESRPHPDFLGPEWWKDLDIIMDEARKLNMKVWILDDSHFPTGYAAGKIKNEFPQFQKLYLKLNQQDFVGPQTNAKIIVKWAAAHNSRNQIMNVGNEVKTNDITEEKIIAVVAAKRKSFEEIDPGSLVDITEHLREGVIYWNMPKGDWRIFTLVQTTEGGEAATESYLNPIVPQATQVLIDTVYQPHHNRYKDDFGSTFAGFFSDEPRFGNVKGPFASIGRLNMVLPWRKDMQEIIEKQLSKGITSLLPLLWVDAGEIANQFRYEYMNIITNLYAENFSNKLGDWCRNHGVEYIGHVMEDNNAHARLGYGAGHFYRSLQGQDMSGIDVVLHQILPGMDQEYFKSFTSTGWDGEFFHYGLGKLGSSLGHIDPKKNGRTMCEIYGAYGWGEGLKLMKWLTDHMLVRGVNYFVPHAFSPKRFPDPDCPPHFYANGQNPQYRYMDTLMNYMNRVSHLLTNGKHIAPVAIMYHGEAEWSGNYMLFQKPAKELMQHQIDFDVLPTDTVQSTTLENQQMHVNGENYSVLVIPYAEALPHKLIKNLIKHLRNGLQLVFIDSLPIRSSEGADVSEEIMQFRNHPRCSEVSLAHLGEFLIDKNVNEITLSNHQPYLRYYHYQHNDGDVFMFFNEDPHEEIETKITLPLMGKAYIYDAFANQLLSLPHEKHQGHSSFTLSLSSYESRIIIFSNSIEQTVEKNNIQKIQHTHILDSTWEISFADALNYPKFSSSFELKELIDLGAPGYYPTFSGTIRYELNFDSRETEKKKVLLSIMEPYEVTDAWINDTHLGVKISPPYKYDVTGLLKKHSNKLVIDVTNTLANQQQDFLSQYLLLEPTGIVGNVQLEYY